MDKHNKGRQLAELQQGYQVGEGQKYLGRDQHNDICRDFIGGEII